LLQLEEWAISLKIDFKGIRFNTWLYFLVFSFSILALLGFLLLVLIKPYYRQNKLSFIDNITAQIESSLINSKADQTAVDNMSKLVMGNNACALIFNENGNVIYESDSLGELCLLNKDIEIDGRHYILSQNPDELKALLTDDNLNMTITSPLSSSEMLLYGKFIRSELANYYFVLNTPIEPVESYIDFIMRQYLYIALIVVCISLFVSFLLSGKIALPIVRMKKEADLLADGKYNVSFETASYSEINDLAITLNDATNKLSKVDELRKDLVANVSHDIKTPLTMIKAYGEMIKDISGDDPLKRNEHLDVILKETDYLSRLVSDMQEYSKMQAGYIELKKTNFDLNEVCLEVVDLLQQLIDDKQLDLKLNLLPVVVYGDEIKISQVVYNFLSNAIKHSSDGSAIEINIIDSEEKVRLEVRDYGEGIAEDSLPYIWDRYYKIDKSFNRSQNSTGLGLAIAKAILEAHNADYGVVSQVDEGSTFYFEINKDYEDETM